MSDTPITDAAKWTDDPKQEVGFVVPAEIAADLERENAKLKEDRDEARKARDTAEAKSRWIEGIKPCADIVELVGKMPPDILMAPMPFPDRLSYAAKMIQAAFEAWITSGSWLETLNQLRADLAAAQAEIHRMKEKLDWQNMPNRNPATRGAYEFYINEEWTGIRTLALDSDAGSHAALRKRRLDPDDERVRIRRVLDDDALLADLAAANARIVDLEQAWEEIFESRPVNGMSYTEAARALKAQLAAANERAERAEAKAAVIGGEWCAENRAAGRGPCGACAWCCQQASAQSDTLRRALEVCQDALTDGGDRLVVLINSERSKCKGDHWDFWDYLAEKLRLALTSAKSALGQK